MHNISLEVNYGNSSKVHNMLRHQYEDLFKNLFEFRDAKWKNEENYRDVSPLFLFLPL